jgi:hypothetical protein
MEEFPFVMGRKGDYSELISSPMVPIPDNGNQYPVERLHLLGKVVPIG